MGEEIGCLIIYDTADNEQLEGFMMVCILLKTVAMEKMMNKDGFIHVNRGLHSRHSIDCGDDTVIHLAGESAQMASAAVKRMPLNYFSLGGIGAIVTRSNAYPQDHHNLGRDQVGMSELSGLHIYDIINNSHEHLAR